MNVVSRVTSSERQVMKGLQRMSIDLNPANLHFAPLV